MNFGPLDLQSDVLLSALWSLAFKANILFVLSFYGPVNQIVSCRTWSVYLTSLLLGRLSSLKG